MGTWTRDNDVQGNIKATEISRFRPMIEEGRIHILSKFKVITAYGNNTVSSSSASRVYINFDDPKVKDLSQRYLNDSEELLQIIPTPVNYSADQPQLIKATNGTLNDLLFFNDPGTSNEYYFICEVIIIGIIEHMKWRYSGCPDCSKKSLIAGNSFWCEKCNKQVMAQNCYKITLEVEDYSAVSTITLFNREAEKLFKVSADEMAKNLVKIKGKEVFPPLIKGIVGKKIKVQIKLTKYNYIEGNEGFTVMKLIEDLHDRNKESYIENTPQDVFAQQNSDVISLTEEGPPTTPLTTPISKSVLKNTTNVMIKPKIEKAVNNNLVVNNSIEVEEKSGNIEQLKLPMQEGADAKSGYPIRPTFITGHSLTHPSFTAVQQTMWPGSINPSLHSVLGFIVFLRLQFLGLYCTEIRVSILGCPDLEIAVRLTVEVPPAVCQECHKKVLVEYSKQVKVPGFRPGKRIPENILINYVGKQNVQGATIEAILKKTLPHAVSSVEGRALKDSHPTSITKFSDMSDTFSLQDILRYDVMVDVAPEVKWLSESKYKNLKVVVELDDSINAQNAAEKEFTRRCKSLGALKIVTDRGLQIGDLVVLDIFATTVEEDESKAQKIPSAERKGFHLDTEESDNLLPGFLDAISGIRPDETRSFPLQFPESWEQENLRGVNSQFTVQEAIFERCKEAEQTAIEQATDNAILDQLCKLVEVDIPESLFEEQGRQLYGANLLQIHASNKLSEQQLASLSSEKAVKTYLESQRDTITNIVKQMLVVAEIFKGENLEYPTEELVKEVQKSVAEFKRHNQEYDEERIKDQVQDVLEGAKVLEWLRENSEIEFVKK
ncbi:uncharacterized protein A4U43_C01F4950 [Asparagus officinalis]|uniref:peptidylprolyl isomerase n=1 Tax=Asparagus officinalis TaxID=4686 RepID=A0A5P1FM37_ASPOF|nr:uncharacterized protein A4U43_C01F4950 [Asparagus officinalis]